MNVLEADREHGYQELQIKACTSFYQIFGEFLSEQQKNYMLSPNVIVTDSEHLRFLNSNWVSDAKLGVNSPLNGKLYTSYSAIDVTAIEEDKLSTEVGWDSARQFWSGRLAVVPLFKNFETIRAMPDLLRTQEEEDKVPVDFSSIPEKVVAQAWSAMALHEKIHGIHRSDLSLPIMEIATHFYENRTFALAGSPERHPTGFEQANIFWEELVHEIGSDLHRFIFGNLVGLAAGIIEAKLHVRLSEKKMSDLFESSDAIVNIRWESELR